MARKKADEITADQARGLIREATRTGRYKNRRLAANLFLVPRPAKDGHQWYVQLRWLENGTSQRSYSFGLYDADRHQRYIADAALAREAIRAGNNPLNVLGKSGGGGIATYAEYAEAFLRDKFPGNDKAARNTKSCIRKRVRGREYRGLGSQPIDRIVLDDIKRALGADNDGDFDNVGHYENAGDWFRTPKSAHDAAQRIRRVIDYGYEQAEIAETRRNPADWLRLKKMFPDQPEHDEQSYSERSVHPDEIPAAFRELATAEVAGYRGWGAFALRLLILTAARTNEIRAMRWDQINWETKVWLRPVKGKRPHRVPLSEPALALLREIEQLITQRGPYVIRGQKLNTGLTENTIREAMKLTSFGKELRDDDDEPIHPIPHGFRSSFSDWCDINNMSRRYSEKVVSLCLSHMKGKDKDAEKDDGRIRHRHYSNADRLFDQRRELMELWGRHVTGQAVALGPVPVPASRLAA